MPVPGPVVRPSARRCRHAAGHSRDRVFQPRSDREGPAGVPTNRAKEIGHAVWLDPACSFSQPKQQAGVPNVGRSGASRRHPTCHAVQRSRHANGPSRRGPVAAWPATSARRRATVHRELRRRRPCLLRYASWRASARSQCGVKRLKRLTRVKSMPSRIIWNCPALSSMRVLPSWGVGKW